MNQFFKNVKIVPGKKPEAAVTATTADYPTAGVDVRGFTKVDVLVHVGTLDSILTATLMCNTASTGGTLDIISTASAKNTIAADDDSQVFLFNVEVDKLPEDHHFLTCRLKGATGNDYADVLFLLHGATFLPVTQATAVIPSGNVKTFAG